MASNPGEWPEQRVGLFVDTQNLYYAARQQFESRVDYEKLLTLALRGRRLASATAYVVERDGESVAFGFVTKLSSLGYRVRRKKSVERRSEQGDIVIDGDWDMGIAADIVRAWDGLQVVVLASGDGDFVPLLDLAQARGCRVEVLAFRATTSQSLLDLADRFDDLSDGGVLLE